MSERLSSYKDLVSFLMDEMAPFRHDPEAQVVQITSGPEDDSLYLRWEKQENFIQLIAPMIMDVPAERVADLLEAANRVNHAVVLPGFGFDFTRNFLYFRVTLPYEAEGVQKDLLRRMMLGALGSARELRAPFRSVVLGAPGATVLEHLGRPEGRGEDA